MYNNLTPIPFHSLCQSAVTSESYHIIELADLVEAAAQASTSQYSLDAKKIVTMVKSVIKDGLLVAPQMADYQDKLYTVSGRHRTATIAEIVTNYGVNAKGKVELSTDANELTRISGRVAVDMVKVDSLRTLCALILAQNASRKMTKPETASVTEAGGYATKMDKFKLRFAPILQAALELFDGADKAITVSPVTLQQIAGKLVSSVHVDEEGVRTKIGIKGLDLADDDQLATIASHLQDYLTSADVELPTKFAQYYGTFITDFLMQPLELVDDDGDPIVTYDADGNEIDILYYQHMAKQMPTESKVSKAPRKKGVSVEAFEAMKAKLLALGVNPEELN
jgi:hypothetical protein